MSVDCEGEYEILNETVVSGKSHKRPLIFDLNLPKEDIVSLAKALVFGSFIIGGFIGVFASIFIFQ